MKRWPALLILGLLGGACAPARPASPEPPAPTPVGATSMPAPTTVPGGGERPPAGAEREFRTDFSIHSVPYSEILSGGPSKDGIPALLDPSIVSIADADAWLVPQEAVVVVEVEGQGRAYPVQVLMWHEIVNDIVAGVPLAVTYCPLCNTAVAFERTFEGQVLDFGTTGRLRFSNLVMYDRQTETWWQQANGEAIVGALTGSRLTFYPALIVSWDDFKAAYPEGTVVSQDTGHFRPYGSNPYQGYDAVRNRPFLYRGPETPSGAALMERVLAIELNGESAAYAYDLLADVGVVNDDLGGQAIVVFWQPGVASALDTSSVAGGRDVGTAAAYSRLLDGETLTFRFDDGRIFDEQSRSEWDVLGRAVGGPRLGSRLEPVISVNHFWFSAAAFAPETRLFTP